MKEYKAVKENNKGITHIRVDVDYTLGGYSYATYKQIPRGYYVNVLPVERRNHGTWTSEGFTCFTGTSYLLKAVARKSAKAEAEAVAMAKGMTDNLIAEICAKNGLELA